MINNLINHVALIVDSSSSINSYGLTDTIIKVLDGQISYLASRSKEMDQETRITVYTFADDVKCLIWEKDVLRLPSLKEHYKPEGNTALIDAVLTAISDMKQIPEKHGNHAHLLFLVTDGENNRNPGRATELSSTLRGLPDNWTVAAMVPNQNGVFECKRAGFAAENISLWSTTVRGTEEVGRVMQQSTDNFMQARSTGVRGTKSLFTMNASNLSAAAVNTNLTELSPTEYDLLNVHKKAVIKPFVESWKIPFRLGAAYYQLSKPEKVQGHKQICIQNKRTAKVYGGANARKLLGLPDYEVQVEPAAHPEYDLFIQSTSNNRNLVAGTKLLVMK